MKAQKVYGNDGKQRQRISDELRQLKLMSKGLRTNSLRARMKRHASQRPETLPDRPAKPAPTKPTRAVAA
ncbi:MAG: hypothetical protein J0J01_13240 [Reyranella sp.]|uniref:hypothetical protein n=1 Tax=Reyranella sp. TaxID=1929291 RepID=UPI001AD54E68|nr:hypothetical protein [Reyranella sp.]MBN9087869.1 hypothetical protein [Reyranella sp.]